MEKIENYKLAAKLEVEKYLEKIQSLEDKIESLEYSNGSKYDIDNLVHEYNNYKERLKRQINEYIKNEENLTQQIESKDRMIEKCYHFLYLVGINIQLDLYSHISHSKQKLHISL